jgi:hypothetical protein
LLRRTFEAAEGAAAQGRPQPIGDQRARYAAITCSSEHSAIRKASIRSRSDLRRCRHCQKPSTPIERAAFRRFRSLELTRPDLLYPVPFKQWQSTGGDIPSFLEAVQHGTIDLELINRRFKDAPGGAKSGRPRAKWEGGYPDCAHALRVRRKGGKPIPAALSNVCRTPGCGAIRVGMAQREPDPVAPKQEETIS